MHAKMDLKLYEFHAHHPSWTLSYEIRLDGEL